MEHHYRQHVVVYDTSYDDNPNSGWEQPKSASVKGWRFALSLCQYQLPSLRVKKKQKRRQLRRPAVGSITALSYRAVPLRPSDRFSKKKTA